MLVELFSHHDGSWHGRVNVHGTHRETARYVASSRWRAFLKAALAAYRLACDIETAETAPSVMPKRAKR